MSCTENGLQIFPVLIENLVQMFRVQIGIGISACLGDFPGMQLNCPLSMVVGGKKSSLGSISKLSWISSSW